MNLIIPTMYQRPRCRQPAHFLQLAGISWTRRKNDSEDIWTISEGIDYPRLAWEPNCIVCTHEDYLECVSVDKPECWCTRPSVTVMWMVSSVEAQRCAIIMLGHFIFSFTFLRRGRVRLPCSNLQRESYTTL